MKTVVLDSSSIAKAFNRKHKAEERLAQAEEKYDLICSVKAKLDSSHTEEHKVVDDMISASKSLVDRFQKELNDAVSLGMTGE